MTWWGQGIDSASNIGLDSDRPPSPGRPVDERGMMRHRGASSWAWTVLAVLGAWLLCAPRLVPSSSGDEGTFVSVAERLRAGDRLYVDVWDNKDPLFYYLLALARSVSEHGELLLELVWLVLACWATQGLARSIGVPSRQGVVVGWAAAPLLLTGSAYTAGQTHLPALAITLCALRTALDRRWVLAGACVSLVVVLKLVMCPLAVLLVALAWWRERTTAAALRATAGGLLVLIPAGIVMAARGELAGYLDMQAANFGYSHGDGLIDSRWGSAAGHLLRAMPEDGAAGGVTTIASIALVLLIVRGGPHGSVARVLHRGAVGTLVTAGVILAGTGLWPGHTQVLYLPGVLVAVTWAAHLANNADRGSLRRTALVMLAAFLIGGASHPLSYVDSVRGVSKSLRSLAGTSVPARALLETAPTGRYARLGTNDLDAHARGLWSWQLVCPRFDQYPFDPPQSFDKAIQCLPRADAVIVSPSFVTLEGQEHWNDFVDEARDLLDRDYHCNPTSFGQLCTRN